MFLALLLGFSSGLPYAAVESTLQAWLTNAQIDTRTIGTFSYVLMPYALKFLWAPLLDQYAAPFLGLRRGWGVLAQCGVAASFFAMACCDPVNDIVFLGVFAAMAAFFSASQDIVLDAHRRETFAESELGLASTLFTNGYRIGLIASGAYALVLSEYRPWWQVYTFLGIASLACTVAVLASREPEVPDRQLKKRIDRDWVRDLLVPFQEFFSRRGWITIFGFIVLYKMGDSMAAALRTTFLLDIHYSKKEIAEISKAVGLAASIAGAFVGGTILLRKSLTWALIVFGMLQAVSTFGFWIVARIPPHLGVLAGVIGFENFTSGLGTAAFVAFIASVCDRRFSGTQYAGLTSLMKIPAIVASSQTGYIVEGVGWANFFIICVVVAVPPLFLIPFLPRLRVTHVPEVEV